MLKKSYVVAFFFTYYKRVEMLVWRLVEEYEVLVIESKKPVIKIIFAGLC